MKRHLQSVFDIGIPGFLMLRGLSENNNFITSVVYFYNIGKNFGKITMKKLQCHLMLIGQAFCIKLLISVNNNS